MTSNPVESTAPAADAHINDPRFVKYYEQESTSDRALVRAQGIMNLILRERAREGRSGRAPGALGHVNTK